MAAIFPVGSNVTVTAKSPVPVAGSGDDHTGKTGRVHGYADLAPKSGDIIHVVDLDEPMFVHLPNEPQFDPNTGEKLQGHKVEWIEVPASCLK
jgi:hypothetical protein